MTPNSEPSDEMRQNPTLTTTTAVQDIAVDELAAGATTAEAADAAGVSRQTVSKWRNSHPGFQAALNLRRRELNAERADRIRDLDAQALHTVAQAIANGDTRAALEWIKSRHLHTVDVDKTGLVDAEAIIDRQAETIRRRPEHKPVVLQMLDNDQSTLSRTDAIDIAEAELLALLDDG